MAWTARQRRFVVEYVTDFNGAAAAVRAGYAAKWADREAGKLLRKPHVAAAVDEQRTAALARAGANGDRVLGELARVGFAGPAQLKAMGARVSDKIAALVHLGRHLGLFTDKVEHRVTDDLAERIREGRERARAMRAGEGAADG